MISGVKIPVICPYKFYAADFEFNNGINFENVDNRESTSQEWKGLYPHEFYQGVPFFWNDLNPGLDFQVYATAAVQNDIEAYLYDTDGNLIQQFTKESFFNYDPPSGDRQLRFYIESILGIDIDKCFKIYIKNTTSTLYYSENIKLSQSFSNNHPLMYNNFENDFGIIFLNSSDTAWKGKMMVPMRMWEPAPSDERESYLDDSGELVTLRSLPQRKYKFETLPVPSYFAEKIKLIFSCSDLTMNKLSVNAEELPEIEVISQSNLCVVTGEVQLKDYAGEYWQEEEVSTVSEVLESWTAQANVSLFDSDGKEILAWFHDNSITTDNDISSNIFSAEIADKLMFIFDVRNYNNGYIRMNEERILMSHDFIYLDDDYIDSDDIEVEIWNTSPGAVEASFNLSHNRNFFSHTAVVGGNYYLKLKPRNIETRIFLEITPSVLKIS